MSEALHYIFDRIWRLANQTVRPYMRMRKDIGALALADLRRCAIWEFALDEEGAEGQDECTVRPRLDCWSFPGRLMAGNAFVYTRFIAAAGRVFEGMIMPLDEPDIIHMRPVIMGAGIPIELTIQGFGPSEGMPPEQQVEETYARLQITPAELFPLRVEPMVRLGRLYGRGVLDGFAERVIDEDDPDAEPTIRWHR